MKVFQNLSQKPFKRVVEKKSFKLSWKSTSSSIVVIYENMVIVKNPKVNISRTAVSKMDS